MSAPTPSAPAPARGHYLLKRVLLAVLSLALVYFAVTYLLIPALWKLYAYRHPGLEEIPGITYTADRIPGDPLNVALVGTEEEVMRIFAKAGWHKAAKLGLLSDLKIAEATVLKRSDETAPVSSLYLFGREQDLAFEQQYGPDPRKRHHVRFWRCPKEDADGRPAWVGSATFDVRVGFSHTTGEITHHIAPDVDKERDHVFQTLEKTGELSKVYTIDDFHKVREGKNGGGDPWHTDGKLEVGVIKE